jgi:Tol biopolymer transport system component
MPLRLTSLALALLGVFVVGTVAARSQAQPPGAYRAGIYSVREDGSGRREIAVPDPSLTSFIRSPGGRSILFTRQVDDAGALYAAERSGANPVRLTPSGFEGYPDVGGAAFSPDGRLVAFTGSTTCGWRCAHYSLYLVGRDGSGLRMIADGARQPSWAPAGRRLAYAGTGGISVVDVQTGERTTVATGYVYRPLWAPRGQRIAYSATMRGYGVACFVNADGSRRRCTHGHSLTNLIWSRDASRVAFRQVTPLRLGTVDADARRFRYLGDPRSTARPVAWSPDGTRIAFAFGSYGSYYDGSVEVRALKSPRRTARVVREQGSYLRDIRWRGHRISYVASRPE